MPGSFRWYVSFKDGIIAVDKRHSPGRPADTTNEDVAKVKYIMNTERQVKCKERGFRNQPWVSSHNFGTKALQATYCSKMGTACTY